MERPAGVTIIALFEFFIATLLILFARASALGVSALGAIVARTREIGTPGLAVFAGAGMIVAFILLLPACLFGVFGFGLWKLRNWARIATIVLAVLGAVGASMGFLWALVHFRILALLVSSIRLSIDLVVLWYLGQPNVRNLSWQVRAASLSPAHATPGHALIFSRKLNRGEMPARSPRKSGFFAMRILCPGHGGS